MSRRRWWLSPRWVLSHLGVLLLIVSMCGAGVWQLSRLADKREVNDRITSREKAPPTAIDALLASSDPFSIGAGLDYRRVTATGRYDPAHEVLIRNVTLGGSPGYWVVTPLIVEPPATTWEDVTSLHDPGYEPSAVMVIRGWVPYALDPDVPVVDAAPPASTGGAAGQVTVTGLAYRSRTVDDIPGVADVPDGALDVFNRVDLARMQDQLDLDLYPIAIQLAEQAPAQSGELPVVLPPPDPDEGPHLGYAVQWFTFSAIALFGYPMVLVRVGQAKRKEATLAELGAVVAGDGADHVRS